MSVIYFTMCRHYPAYFKSSALLRMSVLRLSLSHSQRFHILYCSRSPHHLSAISASALPEAPFALSAVANPQPSKVNVEERTAQKGVKGPAPQQETKPNRDRLQNVHDILVESLTQLFARPMNYSIYNNNDFVFIDNIRNKKIQGVYPYVQQVALLRTVGHLKFAYVKFHILNTSISEEESRITIRWRIAGISGLRVMLKFWKFRLWNWRKIMDSQESWYDGISYFDIGSDGLVHRHVADRVMEDKDREVNVTKPNKAMLAAKLGVLTSIFPQSSLTCSESDSKSNLSNSEKKN